MSLKPVRPATLKIALFFVFVVALVSAPFVIWGESFVFPLLESREQQAGWLTVIAIMLLAADSVAPVPSVIVIMFLAAKAGWVAGLLGGTLGLSAGVLTAAWIGRAAVGRVAPRFFPDEEIAHLRESLQRHLVITLACLRSVPVLAETSVIVAASAGIPVRRVFLVTLLPNFVISAIYSFAADDSFLTASVTFLATLAISYVVWRVLRKETLHP
jgi:3-dehydroquinate synthase